MLEKKDQLRGKIVIIHQHAEEAPPGGAKQMIEAGVLDGVDNIFGIHVMSSIDYGTVQYHKGNTQTGRAKFSVKFQGVGGHGSMPHLSNDAIVAASHFVTAVPNHHQKTSLFIPKKDPLAFSTWVQKKEDAPYPHHHPKFDIREDAMLVCAKTMAAVTVKYLMQD